MEPFWNFSSSNYSSRAWGQEWVATRIPSDKCSCTINCYHHDPLSGPRTGSILIGKCPKSRRISLYPQSISNGFLSPQPPIPSFHVGNKEWQKSKPSVVKNVFINWSEYWPSSQVTQASQRFPNTEWKPRINWAKLGMLTQQQIQYSLNS